METEPEGPELDFLGRWHDCLVRDLPLALVDGLARAWLHADFHGQNIVFAADRVRGVFDFDVAHHGWRLEDIAYAMFCFARENRASSVILADAARAFLEPFELTDNERRALPYFVVATQARTAPRYRVRAREGADPAQVLRGHVTRMRALSANLTDLG
jgi:Ser/Thr protein kinase RdoA (MazF antagonist)